MTDSSAELRITAIAPDGRRVTKRLAGSDAANDARTVYFRLSYDDDYAGELLLAQAGTYRVVATNLAGVTVDATTFTVRERPDLRIERAVAATGAVEWSEEPDRVMRLSPDHEIHVAVTVVKDGWLPHEAVVSLETPAGETLPSAHWQTVAFRGDARTGVVFYLSPTEADEIRSIHDGVVHVVLELPDGSERTVTVKLPES